MQVGGTVRLAFQLPPPSLIDTAKSGTAEPERLKPTLLWFQVLFSGGILGISVVNSFCYQLKSRSKSRLQNWVMACV